MNCTEFERYWLVSTEGKLTEGEEARFQAHLAACAGCARLRRELLGLEHQLDGLADLRAEAPPYLKTRVMARLDDVVPARRWRWRRVFNSRRLLAVSMACLAFFAGLMVRELRQINRLFQEGTSQPVVLELAAPDAEEVELVGDFNGWGGEAGRARVERRDGQWVFHLELAPGRYQYAYLVDGKRWLPDPEAPGMIPDGFGGMNSVLYVADAGQGRSL